MVNLASADEKVAKLEAEVERLKAENIRLRRVLRAARSIRGELQKCQTADCGRVATIIEGYDHESGYCALCEQCGQSGPPGQLHGGDHSRVSETYAASVIELCGALDAAEGRCGERCKWNGICEGGADGGSWCREKGTCRARSDLVLCWAHYKLSPPLWLDDPACRGMRSFCRERNRAGRGEAGS